MTASTVSSISAAAARGLTVFMGVMTALWSQFAIDAVWPAAAVGITVGVAITAAAILPWRGSDDEPTGDPGGLDNKVLLVALAAEALLIFGAIVILGRAGHGDYIVPVVALIVAAHFFLFLMAQPFALHIAAGVIGILGSALAIILMLTGVFDADEGHALAGITLATCTAAYGIGFLGLVMRRRDA